MFDKKIGVGLLGLAALGLVACGGGNNPAPASDPSTPSTPSTPASGPDFSSVKEAGKYTLWFELGQGDDNGVKEIPSHNSAFLTGACTGWVTSANDTGAPAEFARLGETNYYYTNIAEENFQTDGAWDATKGGYQVTLGWNSSSNAPADQQGIDWSYKADYNALYPGTSHPVMAAPENGEIHITGGTAVVANPDVPDATSDEHWMCDPNAKLDYLTFSKAKPAPKKVLNYSVSFTLAANDKAGNPLPTDYPVDFYATGSYQGWNGAVDDAHKLTKGEDGKYVINFGDVYGGVKIEYMVVAVTTDNEGNTSGFWNCKLQDDNLSFTPLAADGDDHVEDLGEMQFKEWPANPNVEKIECSFGVMFTDIAAGTVEAPAKVAVKGSWDWDTVYELELQDAGIYGGLVNLPAGDYQFGFPLLDAEGNQTGWVSDATTGQNIAITVSEENSNFMFSGTTAGVSVYDGE